MPQPPLVNEHPNSTLYEAAKKLIQTHARRLPLLDKDTATHHEVIVSVLTQYRLLKFIAINVCSFPPFYPLKKNLNQFFFFFIKCNKEIQQLHMSLRSLRIGTYVAQNAAQEHPENRYYPIATATLSTPVFDVVHMFSERAISAVPIVDEDGVVVNLYETVDVIVRAFF